MPKQKGNGVQDSSAPRAKIYPNGVGADKGAWEDRHAGSGSSHAHIGTYASIPSARPIKGSEKAYAVGMTRRISTEHIKNDTRDVGGNSGLGKKGY